MPSSLDAPLVAPAHEADGQKLIELGQRAQYAIRASKCEPEPNSTKSCPSSIECDIATKLGIAEIMGDVEHPKPAPGFGKLTLRSRT